MSGELERLTDPSLAATVPPEAVPGVLARVSVLQAALIARLNVSAPPASPGDVTERLLTAAEAAAILGVTTRWLYRRSRRLPFARRLSRKVLRFSEAGLRKWILSNRP